jgi:fermentation-respiration switch protein FrsA (DUF1100 family)
MNINFRRVRYFLLALVAVAIGACASLEHLQRAAIFQPSRVVENDPSHYDAAYEELWLPGPAGSGRINAWWVPSALPDAPVLLYLHGNAGNMGPNAPRIVRFRNLGLSVLAIDYRGYGKSEGDGPSEAGVYADAQAAWEYLRLRAPGARVYIYGHSLGGAVAIELASHHPEAAGLIVESTFTSVKDAAQDTPYRLLASDLFLTQRFASIEKVPALKMPLLFIHGVADTLIPSRMSEALYAAAPEPKRLVLIEGAGHADVPARGGERYVAAWRDLLDKSATGRRAP